MVINPDEPMKYVLRGAAAALMRLKSREILLEGPAGTGKTTAACLRIGDLAERFPGCRLLMCRKTRASMTQSVLVTFERTPVGIIAANIPATARDHRSVYRLPNGSEIVVCGLDNVDRIMSAEYDHVTVFEATETSADDWEKLSTRLRNGKIGWHQAVADCNPGAPSHWLNQRAEKGLMRRLRSRHEDNPFLWDGRNWTAGGKDYIDRLGNLSGVRKQRLLSGMWAASDGLVYPGLFDSTYSGVLPSTPIYAAAGLDWGWTDPTALCAGALCQDGCVYVVAEIYESRIPFDVLALRLRQLIRDWNIETFFCDPARADLIALARRMDCPTRPHKIRQIETGIAMVEQRLTRGLLRVSDTCTQTLREATEYEYGKDKEGVPKNKPTDKNNHAMDALRYLICGMDEGIELMPELKPADYEEPLIVPARKRTAREVDFRKAAFGED